MGHPLSGRPCNAMAVQCRKYQHACTNQPVADNYLLVIENEQTN